MPPSKPCGQHIELASTDAVRVTRCPCGTLHVTLNDAGVTVRLSAETLRGVVKGLEGVVARLDTPVNLGTSSIN